MSTLLKVAGNFSIMLLYQTLLCLQNRNFPWGNFFLLDYAYLKYSYTDDLFSKVQLLVWKEATLPGAFQEGCWGTAARRIGCLISLLLGNLMQNVTLSWSFVNSQLFVEQANLSCMEPSLLCLLLCVFWSWAAVTEVCCLACQKAKPRQLCPPTAELPCCMEVSTCELLWVTSAFVKLSSSWCMFSKRSETLQSKSDGGFHFFVQCMKRGLCGKVVLFFFVVMLANQWLNSWSCLCWRTHSTTLMSHKWLNQNRDLPAVLHSETISFQKGLNADLDDTDGN